MKTFLFVVFAVLFCAVCVEGRSFVNIDNFATSQPPLILVVETQATNGDEWYAPYQNDVAYAGPPLAVFQTTTDCIGGHRDLILGYEIITPQGSVAIISLVNQRASVAFPLNYVGGAYVQWDGVDTTVTGDPTRANAFPGATLNTSPGIGSGISAGIPESNGQFVDFTSGGRATSITISISSDLEVNYYMDAIDSAGERNEYPWTHTANGGTQTQYSFPFNDFTCSTSSTNEDEFCWLNPAFNWAAVAAFQVRIFTFRPGADQEAESIDTDFFDIFTRGYIIEGLVFIDCGCDTISDDLVEGETINLINVNNNQVIDTTVTGPDGSFTFFGLTDGTYRVCVANTAQDFCPNQSGLDSNRCRTVVLANFDDPPVLTYALTQATTLIPPPDITIDCDDCIDPTPSCTGPAQATNCGGGSPVPVTTFTDGPTTGTCTRTFVRTFTDQGLTATQRITIIDDEAPLIVTPASPVTRDCDDTSSQSFQQWRTNRAGATWDDCTPMTFTDDIGARTPGNCGSVTATFFATDACGASTPSTATYTVNDFDAPTFTTPPQNDGADCDANGGSDFAAFNTWLATNAGATATDNCSGATITDDFPNGGQPQRGCAQSNIVTFTATDSCGNTANLAADFVISDTSGPTLSQPSSPTVPCNDQTSTNFQTWLSTAGGATASDDCGSLSSGITNDSNGIAPFGCDENVVVTFTATDDCGQSTSRTGTYRVRDTTPPTLTTPASQLNVNCETQGGNELNNWLSDAGGARATDACSGNINFTNDFDNLAGDCTGVPVTFEGCDACQQCVRTTATYSIVDTTPPSFVTPPQDLSVECGSDTQTAYTNWRNSNANANAQDSCASQNEITITNNGNQNAPVLGNQCTSFVDVAFVARDPCGNSSPPSTARFSVTDNFAPTISPFPADQTVDCAGNNNNQYTTWRSDRGGARATDSCTSVQWSNDGPASFTLTNGDCFDSVTVTFTASDSCGNVASAAAEFTIQDNTPPTINPQSSDAASECNTNGVDAWLADFGGARATDTCTGITWTNNFNGFNGGCTETAFVTFSASDACGRTTDTSATYSISDSTPPVINPRASPRTVPCDENTGTELSNWLNSNGGAVATDACQSDQTLSWSNNFNSGAIVGCDFEQVTFTVVDACGQQASTTATFTSVDNTAPTFSPAAQDRTVECNGNGNTGDYQNFVESRAGAVAVDQCALSFTWTSNAPATGPTTCRSQPVTFTVEDECGNSAATTAVYTVADTIAPTFGILPSNRNVECDGTGNTMDRNMWVSTNAGSTATDICASTVVFAQSITDQTGDSCSNTDTYMFTASDACGNSESATATFTVHDFSAPTITVEPTDATFECDGNGNLNQITSWVNDNAGARASDVCQGAVQWTNDFNGNGLFTCTSVLVGFTASDGCGNVVQRTSTVTVEDTIPPVFSFFPQDITIPCDADASTDVLGFAEAFDACAGDLIVNLSEVQFDEPPVGDCPGDKIITRTFSTIDACGNPLTRDQVITVVIQRASGPCDPVGCECDGCCPPAAASDCIAVDCQAVACRSTPCEASLCSCSLTGNKDIEKVDIDLELPLCKPVYIYVNDDDDSMTDESTEVAKNRMYVTNEPIHENFLKNKSI